MLVKLEGKVSDGLQNKKKRAIRIAKGMDGEARAMNIAMGNGWKQEKVNEAYEGREARVIRVVMGEGWEREKGCKASEGRG